MQHLRRCRFLIFSLFLFQLPAFARTVTLPVHGLLVATEEPVPLAVEWDENWFYQTPTTVYNHKIARIAALFSEISYVSVEKNPESNPLIQSYRALGFKDESVETNYLLDYSIPITGNNQAAYSFANKDIQTPDGTKKLVFIVLRGTPLSANEWISNVNVSDTTHKDVLIHEGFFDTMGNVHKSLIYYLLKNKISPDEAYFLITGHSRGAALANLLGATLEDEGIITGERLFVYTFAAPNVTQKENYNDPKYDFIWNIVNAEDIVPSVPPDRNNWHWKRFGHTKVLANFWNTEPQIYNENYIPRVNAIFSRLLLREYSPFKSGPFYQTQVARVLTTLYKNIEKYYGSIFGLRGIAENILRKNFSEKTDSDSETEKQSFIVKKIQESINLNTEIGFEYVTDAFIDMHACETYISLMLALEENEAFSEDGSSQIVLNGNYDLAVYDDDGTLLCRVVDGLLEIYSIKTPVAAMPLVRRTVIGFPENKNLSVVLLKNSILPTVVSYKIEYYSAEGKFLGESYKHYLFPQGNSSLSFTAGESLFATEKLDTKRLSAKETKLLAKKYDLRQDIKFRIQPELSYTNDRIFTFGIRSGSQALFGNVLGSFSVKNLGRAYGLSLGIGHQHSLYGKILLDAEGFNKFVWSYDDVNGRKFNVVPMARFTLSYKPLHRLHLFAGALFELYIHNINDGAFDAINRDKKLNTLDLGSNAGIVPSFMFGIRF